MKLHRLFLVALSAIALALAGCGGDDDDNGGSSGTGSGGGDNHGITGTQVTPANASQVQAAVFTTMGTAMAKLRGQSGTYDGAVSGKVKVTMSLSKPLQTGVKYKMEFDNYSDDGQVYLDGTIQYNMTMPNWSYSIDVTLSGEYTGAVKGDVRMENGRVSGSWTSNGTSVTF